MAQSYCVNHTTNLSWKVPLRPDSPSLWYRTFISSNSTRRKFCSMVISASSPPSAVSGEPSKSILLTNNGRKNELMDAIKSSLSNCLSETHLNLDVPALQSKTRGKEYVRLWFQDNCNPYEDEILPDAPEELVSELYWRYILLYETITKSKFELPSTKEPIHDRISLNVSRALPSLR